MVSNIFFTSDSHFNHGSMLKFKRKDGSPARPGFTDVEHMNEVMINNWNSVVKDSDIIYHLGDVYMGKEDEAEKILKRLKGKKRLVLGNHDMIDSKSVLPKFFKKITLWRLFKEHNFICTHAPAHPNTFDHKGYINVMGHTHYRGPPQGPHVSVCVELTDYKPVAIEDINELYKKQQSLFFGSSL